MNTFDEGLILRVLGDAFRLGFILLRNSGKVIKLRRLPLQDGNLPSASHESGNELLKTKDLPPKVTAKIPHVGLTLHL